MVNTVGPDGSYHDYQIKYTFGIHPLQQYMVEFPDGRVQVLRVSWDQIRKEWFYVAPVDAADTPLEPGDPLHWTGLGQNWNTMCADCHSTDFRKNFDLARNEYHSEFFEIDVSCESCHGPGSLHVELAESRSLFWDRRHGYGLTNPLKQVSNQHQIETCAPCHSRRAAIHPDYTAAKRWSDHFEPQLLTAGLYHADGQILDEVYVYGSFLQSKMYHKDVRCTDCHNPHSLKLKFEGNRLCTQCHQPGVYDGANHHRHADPEATQCVSCHMPSRLYMEIDARRDHSIRVPRPDLSVVLGTPNACNDCHGKPEETFEWAAAAVREWYGDKRPDDPHWAPAIAGARQSIPSGDDMLAQLLRRRDLPDIVRATAVELLANYPNEESLIRRRDALKHDSPLVRSAAVRSITVPPNADQMGVPATDTATRTAYARLQRQFVRDLEPLLRDPVRSVRLAAANRLVAAVGQLPGIQFRDALDKAIEEFRLAQAMMLDRPESHLNLAILSQNLNDLRAAERHLRTAIRVAPYRTDPREILASLLQQVGGDPEEIRRLREEEADNLLRDARLLPSASLPHYRRGLLLYLLGRGAEAREELAEACRLGPNEYSNWLAYVQLCKAQEKWSEVQRALNRMEQLQPGSPDVRNILLELQSSGGAAGTSDNPE